MEKGWIKLHRKIWDNPIVTKDADHLAVWIYLLTHATHRPRDVWYGGKRITLREGQLITGRLKIAGNTGVESSKVYRILKIFKSEQQIEQQTNSQNSLITILRWHDYQESEQQNEQRVNNECTTSEQRVNTNKNIRIKELKKKDDDSRWVSDGLSNREWEKLKLRFEDVVGLVDLVDLHADANEVNNPYAYILKVAEERGWPTRR